MSLKKSAARRLSLLAGSSLTAAALSIAAPGAALAQTCTPATVTGSGAGADTVQCLAGTFAAGITFSSEGGLTVSMVANGTTVSSTVTANGVNLTGNGADAVTWNSTIGGMTGGTTTSGPVIEALSNTGAVTVNTAGVTGSNATITHGIRAVSSGGGAVSVSTTGSVSATSTTGFGLVAGGTAAIEAISTGGNGAVSVVSAANSNASGRLYGIRAQASGTGALTINLGGSTASANSSTGLAGISATTGTGLLTITGRGTGGSGTGVLIDAGGNVVFTGSASGSQYGIRLMNVAAGTTSTLNLNQQTTGTLAVVRAEGAGDLVVNITTGISLLNFDVAGMADRVPVNFVNGGVWRPPEGSSTVPVGNFDIFIAAGGGVVAGVQGNGIIETPTIVTFADPATMISNAGLIIVGSSNTCCSTRIDQHEAEFRLVGLGEFHNSGKIMMGSKTGLLMGSGPTFDGHRSDITEGWYDDVLSIPGVTWVGENGEIVFDVELGRSQANCTDRAPSNGQNGTNDPHGNLGAADCLMLVGGETQGVTNVTVKQVFVGDRGRFSDDGIVLIDVTGGTSAQGHFVISPNSDNYSPTFGGSIDKGLIQFVLVYDAALQQHKLFGVANAAAYQLPLLAGSAQSLWRTSVGGWFDRQADLRGGVEEGLGGGVWLRANGEMADRDVTNVSTAAGASFTFDNSYSQSTYAITGGIDLVSAQTDSVAYVVGLMGGYAHGEVTYDASPNAQRLDGWTGGAYASLLAGGLFIDAAVSANNVLMDNDSPGFGFLPTGTILSSRLISTGAQLEAGWRLAVAQDLFVEPLASVSYVRSVYDESEVRPDDPGRAGLQIGYDDPTSLRASLGGRIALDRDLGAVRAQVSLLARAWNEFEGQNAAFVHNLANPAEPDRLLVDDFGGRFTELSLGASVHSVSGVVSGFLNLGGKFGDDYQAKTGSVGVRVTW